MGRWRSFFRQRFHARAQSPSIEQNVTSTSISTSTGALEDSQNVHESSHIEATSTSDPQDRAKGDHFWKRVKQRYQLVDFHALPEYLRGNEFILRHYRADWPMKETLLSIFKIHNETLNIWT